MTPRQALDLTVRALRASAANAARRNKPTMWAYYSYMEAELRRRLWWTTDAAIMAGCSRLDEEAGAAIVANLTPTATATAWSLGVYARRIRRLAGEPLPRRSLDWLHRHAEARP